MKFKIIIAVLFAGIFLVPSAISAWGYATNTPVFTNEQLPLTGCHYNCPTPTHTPTPSPTPTYTPTPTATPTQPPMPTLQPSVPATPGQTITPTPEVRTNELAHTGTNPTGIIIGVLVILAIGVGIFFYVERKRK